MAQINLQFGVDGERQLSRFFESAGGELDDLSEVFHEWADDFRRRQHGVFAGEGAFEGRRKWRALSPRYREWKEMRYPGMGILERTRNMRLSLTDKSHPDHVEDIEPTEMSIGTSDEKAIHHHHGAPRARLPQRKIIQLTEPQRTDWVRIARDITWGMLQRQAIEARIARVVRRRIGPE